METALEYMANLHPTVIKDYRAPGGQFSESCGCIAVDIARRLIGEGKLPYIARIQGKLIDNINRAPITPKLFGGRVTWGAHQICCEAGVAYDPMVSTEPVIIGGYCQRAFEEEVEMDVLISQESIKEFVGR